MRKKLYLLAISYGFVIQGVHDDQMSCEAEQNTVIPLIRDNYGSNSVIVNAPPYDIAFSSSSDVKVGDNSNVNSDEIGNDWVLTTLKVDPIEQLSKLKQYIQNLETENSTLKTTVNSLVIQVSKLSSEIFGQENKKNKPKKPEQISNQDLVSLLGQITSLEGHIDSQTAEVTALRQRVFLLEQAKAQENQENGNQGMFQSQGLSNTPEVSDTQIRLSRQLSSASEISNTQFRTPGNSSFKVILATILGT